MIDGATANIRPLFVTGIARSGTTLLSRLLNQHPSIRLASDPLLPLMGMIRSRIIEAASARGCDVEPPRGCFPDYYFSWPRIHALREVLAADLKLEVSREFVARVQQAVKARASIEHPELRDLFSTLSGATCQDLLTSSMQTLSQALGTEQTYWVGVKEVWILELLPAILKSLPNAKFVVIVRDPRATLSSMVALRDTYPDEAGHTLSYARHWRKYIALLSQFERESSTKASLLTIHYEDLVDHPEATWRKLCDHLEVERLPAPATILKPDESTRGQLNHWAGNSSYQNSTQGISQRSRDRWRESFPEFDLELTELVCGPEMDLLGYETCQRPGVQDRHNLIQSLQQENTKPYCWRSDLGNAASDIDCEFERLQMLNPDPRGLRPAPDTHFLFQHMSHLLRRQSNDRDVA